MRTQSRSFWVLFGSALLAAEVSGAVDAAPSLISAEDNAAYAVGEICAPYALDNKDRAELPIGRGLVEPDGHDGFARPNPTGVRVGMAGFVHVTFSQGGVGGPRSCDVQAKGADPQALRKAVLDVMSRRVEQFAPQKSKYMPGRFGTEDILCAAADSQHPGAFIMLSSPRADERDRIAMIFTLRGGGDRSAACDHPGVPMNYRTLADPQ